MCVVAVEVIECACLMSAGNKRWRERSRGVVGGARQDWDTSQVLQSEAGRGACQELAVKCTASVGQAAAASGWESSVAGSCGSWGKSVPWFLVSIRCVVELHRTDAWCWHGDSTIDHWSRGHQITDSTTQGVPTCTRRKAVCIGCCQPGWT